MVKVWERRGRENSQIALAARSNLERVITGLGSALWRAVADVVFGFETFGDNAPGQKNVEKREWGCPGAGNCYREKNQ